MGRRSEESDDLVFLTRRREIIRECLVRARGGPHGILRIISEDEMEYLLEPALRALSLESERADRR